jgi:NifU-like domain
MARADEECFRRIEDLVHQLEAIPDAESRKTAYALMEAVMEIHGAGMERMMDIVFDSGQSGKTAIRQFAADKLVASILLLHGLHPDDMETRVQQALGKAHGSAELIGVFEGVVRVRLTASGCGLKETVEAALREAAPDATDFVIEEAAYPTGFVPLTALGQTVLKGA